MALSQSAQLWPRSYCQMCQQGGQQLQQTVQDQISKRLEEMLGGGETSSIVLDKAQKVQQALSTMQT